MRLEKKVAELLTQHNKTLSLAESCTGGHLANLLTNIPGSSAFFKFGVIAYHNDAKTKLLQVPSSFLKKFGAVSPEVAQRMAQNVRKILNTDFSVAITGIAGPTGNTVAKPIGLTYIAAATRKKNFCFKYLFKGNRVQIKRQAARQALKLLINICDE